MAVLRGTQVTPSARERESESKECFGWLKTIALMRKVRHRGVGRVDCIFTMACAAYNLVRMRNLTARSSDCVSPGRRLSSGASG